MLPCEECGTDPCTCGLEDGSHQDSHKAFQEYVESHPDAPEARIFDL